MALSWSGIDSYIGNFGSSELTSHRPCPICGSIKSKVVFEISDFQFFSDSYENPKRVNIRECQCMNCFAIYLNPCYSNYGFQVLFAEASKSYGSSEGHADEEIAWLMERNLLPNGSTVLDVGCYDGRFLAKMPNDVKKIGVDIDEQAINSGRQMFQDQDIDFVLGDFENFQIRSSPNLITMFHVLEHLSHPTAVMNTLRRVSNSETNLVLEVPIIENGATDDINGFFSVQHMTHFSRNSLKNCLALSGWRVIEWCEQSDYNGCRILAEPCEKLSIYDGGSQDVPLLHEYLSGWHEALCRANSKISAHRDVMNFVIWGAGLHTEFLYNTTSFFHANRKCLFIIVDSDEMKHKKTWRGISIYAPSVLKEIDWFHSSLLISSYSSQESIADAAHYLGVPDDRIIRLYDAIHAY